jgi:hypothetical protein
MLATINRGPFLRLVFLWIGFRYVDARVAQLQKIVSYRAVRINSERGKPVGRMWPYDVFVSTRDPPCSLSFDGIASVSSVVLHLRATMLNGSNE